MESDMEKDSSNVKADVSAFPKFVKLRLEYNF
jgi:hypothetical protein